MKTWTTLKSVRHLCFKTNCSSECNSTAAAEKLETLVKLEAEYGPLPDYTPAIEDVLAYLQQVSKSLSANV